MLEPRPHLRSGRRRERVPCLQSNANGTVFARSRCARAQRPEGLAFETTGLPATLAIAGSAGLPGIAREAGAGPPAAPPSVVPAVVSFCVA